MRFLANAVTRVTEIAINSDVRKILQVHSWLLSCSSPQAGRPFPKDQRRGVRQATTKTDSHCDPNCLMRFLREQFYLPSTAQTLKRLVRFLSAKPNPQIATA